MRRVGVIIVLLVVIVGISTVVWAADRGSPSLDDRVRETVLDNGLRVVVVERHTVPTFFALLTFRVGSTLEEQNHSGMSHLLEHMMFKGTKTIGSTDYAAEKKIMDRLEQVAIELKAKQVALKTWRFNPFEEYAVGVKVSLPDSIRDVMGADEGKIWSEVLKRLPTVVDSLPADWRKSPWMIVDGKTNYWEIYRSIVSMRIEMLDMIAQQKKYIPQSEPYDGIFDVLGSQGFNAGTTVDRTEYEIGLPSNCLEKWMYLESDRFQHPIFREFYTEKDVVMEEMRSGDAEPSSVLYDQFQQLIFQAHPYGRSISGWQSDVGLTLRGDMELHYKRFYAPNNAQMTIVGDVKADSVFALAKQYFGSWKRGEPAGEVTTTEPEQNGERRVALEFDAEPELLIAFHAPVAPHPDYYPLALLDMVLASGRTSRFYKSIFVKQELTDGAPWAGAPSGRYDETFTIGATPKAPHTMAEVETAIYAEIDSIKNNPVLQVEIDRARNKYRVSNLGLFRSNYYLGNVLSSSYAQRGDWRTFTQDFDRLMAVTPDDIQRVARKYLVPRNRTVAYIVKPTAVVEPVTETGVGGQK